MRRSVAIPILALLATTSVTRGDPLPGPASIRGVVRDARGRPVAHIPVRCSATFPPDVGVRLSEPTTDVEGRYEIRGVGPGDAWVALLAETDVGSDAERSFAWKGPVVHDFVIHGELDLSGRIVTTEVGPFDLDLDWRVDAGAGAWHATTARRVRLEADGAFRFVALRPGLYTLRVASGGVERAKRDLDLFASAGGLEIVIPPARTASLELKVIASWPEAPAYASTWVCPEAGTAANATHGELRNGAFHFDTLAAGRYEVQVRHVFGDQPETSESRVRWFLIDVPAAGTKAVVECGPEEEVRLTIVPSGGPRFAEGRVTVLHGLLESVTPFEIRRSLDGHVSIWVAPDRTPGLPPGLRTAPVPAPALPLHDVVRGSLRLRVEALGFESVEQTFEIAGPAALEVPLRGLPGRGVALSEGVDASRLQHVRVEARRDEPGAAWTEVLWWRLWPRMSHGPIPGTFRAFLAPGTWRFRATCEQQGDAEMGPFVIEPRGPPLLLTPVWGRGAAVSGRVLLDGLPVQQGLIYTQRLEDGAWRPLTAKEAFIDDGGAYRIQGLSPGRYRFAPTPRGLPLLGEIEVGERDVALDLAHSSLASARPQPTGR